MVGYLVVVQERLCVQLPDHEDLLGRVAWRADKESVWQCSLRLSGSLHPVSQVEQHSDWASPKQANECPKAEFSPHSANETVSKC